MGTDQRENPVPLRLWASVIRVAEKLKKTIAARAMVVRIAISFERISRDDTTLQSKMYRKTSPIFLRNFSRVWKTGPLTSRFYRRAVAQKKRAPSFGALLAVRKELSFR